MRREKPVTLFKGGVCPFRKQKTVVVACGYNKEPFSKLRNAEISSEYHSPLWDVTSSFKLMKKAFKDPTPLPRFIFRREQAFDLL